jgi:hypothetical protein
MHSACSRRLGLCGRPASAIKIHHTFDLDSRKAFVEKSSRQR